MSKVDSWDFGAQYFDSREVIERIEFLEIDEDELDEDEKQELTELREFAEEAEGYVADWVYGETFISDAYFEQYAQEYAYDVGAVGDDAGWPSRHIDWEAAADELKQDYTSFMLRGTEYWAR